LASASLSAYQFGGCVLPGDFPWQLILPHLSANKTVCRGILGPVVATQGSGPYSEDEFDEFLIDCGIRVVHIAGDSPPPTAVVLGRTDWDQAEIDGLINWALANVHVYSQEMVLASMTIGADIYELFPGNPLLMDHPLDPLLEEHPALNRLFGSYEDSPLDVVEDPWGEAAEDPWGPPPTPNSPQYRLIVNFDTGEWPAAGVLSQMGYHVGQSGLLPAPRRAILQQVFEVELVAATPESEAYIEEWGSPRSWQRFIKMRNCLAGFSHGARRRSGDYSEAIGDWESDLEWLTSNCSPFGDDEPPF
jgi:hypothetical protein